MKRNHILVATLAFFLIAAQAFADEAMSIRWDFERSPNEGTWTANADVSGLNTTGGLLVGSATGVNPEITSPEFLFKPQFYDVVEMLIFTESGGDAKLSWAGAKDEADSGFRPEKLVGFYVPAKATDIVRVYPFWHKESQIVRIRIALPPGAFRIAWLQVRQQREPIAPARMIYSWRFAADYRDWNVLSGNAAISPEAGGISIQTDPHLIVGSPSLRVSSEINKYVTLRMKASAGKCGTVAWVTSEQNGMSLLPFDIKSDGRMHTYALDMSKSKDWADQIRLITLKPSDAPTADVVLESLTIAPMPQGPADVIVKQFGTEDTTVVAGKPIKLTAVLKNIGGSQAAHVRALLLVPAGVRLTSGDGAPEKGTAATSAETTHELDSLAVLSEAKLEWNVIADQPGETELSLKVSAEGLEATTETLKLEWKSQATGSASAGS